jgi:hypothetical protein
VKYTEGDTVKFKLKSGELLEGDVLFIERSHREDVLYINSSNRWAYRVSEKRIISMVPKKNKSVQMKNRTPPGGLSNDSNALTLNDNISLSSPPIQRG